MKRKTKTTGSGSIDNSISVMIEPDVARSSLMHDAGDGAARLYLRISGSNRKDNEQGWVRINY